jgi:hypothetical protein
MSVASDCQTGRASALRIAAIGGRFGAVLVLVIIAINANLTGPRGGSAAAEPAVTKMALAPISLAGRWQGPHRSYNRRAADTGQCANGACELTYDIVACPTGWCGIAVTGDATCGAIGLHIALDAKKARPNVFTGTLELAKGSAPYTVEAWHHASDDGAKPALNFIGDTGPELLMMRRSFPFQAELARIGDATCTLEKATS